MAIFYFSLIPSEASQYPDSHMDKLIHFSCYAALSVWFGQIIKSKYTIPLWILFILMGTLIEFLQRETGYRQYELLDIFANTIGIIIGGLISIKFIPNLLINFENKLLKIKSNEN